MGGMAVRQARGVERHARILRAALAVVHREGVAGVTHRTVADEADVPLGSLTYYFPTKDDLLREALLLFVEEEISRLSVLAAALAGRSLEPEQAATGFAALLEASDPEQISQFELYLEAARRPALREAAAACFAAYEEVAVAALRAAGIPDPERRGALVVALADGLGLRRAAAPGTGPDLRDALLALTR
jgi:DNA-binding transcriptional regulator YbjK